MKKLLCLLLAFALVFTCFAGCKKKGTSPEADGNNSQVQEVFEKPENYASIILVTINPQFRLYLGADNTVLAVEPINDDAKSINAKVVFENKKVTEVVDNLVAVANESGFVQEDAVIDIKVSEIIDKAVVADTVLAEIKTAVEDKLEELKIKAEVTTSVETQNAPEDTSSKDEADTQSTTSTPVQNNTSSNKPAAPACTHSSVKAVPTSTGKNIIDSSKLDVFYHGKSCESCGANLGTEKHTVKDGKCTACGQSNFAMFSIYAITASVTDGNDFCAAKINDDGSLNYDLVLENSHFNAKGDWVDEHHKKIAAADMLAEIRKKFIFSDAEFEKLKQKGTYEFSIVTQTYSDGYFYYTDPAAGGPGDYSHEAIGYKDNQNGTFTVYYDYLKGGSDVEENERTHLYYYAVEYSYIGASNLTLIVGEYSSQISGFKPTVESLRVKSIKKVSDISGITKA